MAKIHATKSDLSVQQARNLHLDAQGLLRKPKAKPKPSRTDLLAAIERMQLLQIDSIHVVARSPYLVLFSRLGKYPAGWLNEALERGEIFECWAHEACFAPTAAFALHRAHKIAGGRAHHWACKNAARIHDSQRHGMDRVLVRIREHGSLKASDFKTTQRATTGWWAWKDEKRWLEALFERGELMISRRDRFQRVYDLSERVMANMDVGLEPDEINQSHVSRKLMLNAIKALGITQARWIADYYRTKPRLKDADLDDVVDSGEVMRIKVRGWENPAYVHHEHAAVLRMAEAGTLRATHTTLISPFDPLVWDRERASVMFGFDYTIECYVPETKRRFGYFVLPILDRGAIIGRLDAKAHRVDGLFEIKSIHLEPGIDVDEKRIDAIAGAIQKCADWHETPTIAIRRSDPRFLAGILREVLQSR